MNRTGRTGAAAVQMLVLGSLSSLHGLLLALSFEPYSYSWLAWICLVPLFLGCDYFRNSPLLLVLLALIATFLRASLSFDWLFPTFTLALHTTPKGSTALYVAFIALLALPSVLLSLTLGRLLQEKRGSRWTAQPFLAANCLVVASIGVLAEMVSPALVPVYWGNLISRNLLLSQIVEITGVFGLSFVVLAVNYCVFQLLARSVPRISSNGTLKERNTATRHSLVATSILLLVCMGFGALRIYQIPQLQAAAPTRTVAAVQLNSPLGEISQQHALRDAVHALVSDTIPAMVASAFQADSKPDLVVLPEAAVPFSTTEDNSYTRDWGLYAEPLASALATLATSLKTNIFLGEISITAGNDLDGNTAPHPKNTFAGFNAKGERVKPYEKHILFPMGEYLPFPEWFERLHLNSWLPPHLTQTRFYPGERIQLLPFEVSRPQIIGANGAAPSNTRTSAQFVPLICYEALFAKHVRRFFSTEQGFPEFLVNITQDGWFGPSAAPFQHLELARLRAIESRRALIRSANSGISATFGWDGRPLQPLQGSVYTQPGERTLQIWEVPINRQGPTFFMKFGNLWLGMVICGLALQAFMQIFRRNAEREPRLANAE